MGGSEEQRAPEHGTGCARPALSDGKRRYSSYRLPLSVSCASPRFTHRLVGLVVKASASRAEGPGFESRLRWDFFGVESYQ